MKVTLESTSAIVSYQGQPCRIWQGKTEKGVECFAIVALIAHHKDGDAAEFEADLQEVITPSEAAMECFYPFHPRKPN
jgi:hypothetical protein